MIKNITIKIIMFQTLTKKKTIKRKQNILFALTLYFHNNLVKRIKKLRFFFSLSLSRSLFVKNKC